MKKKTARTLSGFDISIRDWLKSKPYEHSDDRYDRHYLKCCNEVFKIMNPYKDWFDDGELTRENRKELACMLVSYFEDFICEIGIWKTFIEYNKELHGYYLPFYDLSDYDPEYLNVEDIAYLNWHVMTKCLDTRIYAPDHVYVMELAAKVFVYLEDRIEETPGIDFYEQYLKVTASMDLYELKDKLFWMSTKSYLMGWEFGAKWEDESVKLVKAYSNQPEMIAPMNYAMTEDFIYSKRSPFAAMNAPEWLSKLARCDDQTREVIRQLSQRHQGYYTCTGITDGHYIFQNIKTEKEYLVVKHSIKNPLTDRDINNITYIMNLVKWDGDWWLTGMMSGWVMGEQERKKAMNQPVSQFWAWPEETQKRLRDSTEKMYHAFTDLFGSPLALFSNRAEFEKANRDFFQHYTASLGVEPDPDYERRRKEYQELFGGTDILDFSQFPKTDGYGIFFLKGVGMISLSDIQDIIISQKKKNLTKEEQVDLFYNIVYNTQPEVADYLLERFGHENFRHPVDASKIDPYRDRYFYWRFYHPDEFGGHYPMMSEVSM
jgi:hypothetical protein